MQLFSEDTTMFLKKTNIFFAPENMIKPPSKVAHNQPRPFFFSKYCQSAQIQPKTQSLTVNNYMQVTGMTTGENFAFFIYWHFVEIL